MNQEQIIAIAKSALGQGDHHCACCGLDAVVFAEEVIRALLEGGEPAARYWTRDGKFEAIDLPVEAVARTIPLYLHPSPSSKP